MAFQHGHSGYVSGCRCAACLEGNRTYSREYRAANSSEWNRRRREHRAAQRLRRLPPPQMVPTDTDLAWAAGFIDGEGHIGINMAGDSTQMAVSVSNTDLRSIKRFAELFGGKLHYTTPGTGGKRPVHYWRAAGHGAAGVLRQVYPYLVIKKEQADVAFDYAATLLPPGKRGLDLSTRETRAALMYRLRSIRKAG